MRKTYLFFILAIVIFATYVVKINLSLALENVDWLKIKRVRFYGLKSIQAKELVQRISLNQNTSLVFLNKKQIKQTIERDKRLKVESITTDMPDTLEIHLKEDIGAFLFRDGKDLYALNREGDTLSSNEDIYFYDLPVLSSNKKNGRNSENESIKHTARSLGNIFAALPQAERDFEELISEIVIDNKATLYLRNRIKVIAAIPLTLDKIRKARYSTLYAMSLERKVDTIDTRADLVRFRFH